MPSPDTLLRVSGGTEADTRLHKIFKANNFFFFFFNLCVCLTKKESENNPFLHIFPKIFHNGVERNATIMGRRSFGFGLKLAKF